MMIEKNNSKKLIIGVSILFCTVILIIGATTAYFTQSGIGETGNIVTTNINGTIEYTDNNDYMRGNLIPVIESDAPLFAMKNSINPSGEYTNEDICTYKDDMYACSLYEFTITNNANVTQDMMVTLTPYPNGFGNLYYMVYESKQLELKSDSIVAKNATHIDKTNSSTMINSVILKPGESKTYTVVFYIKSMNYDQTSEDAGKRFGAIIRVDSTTTKASTSVVVGETCYEMEELDDGTYKLTSFNGIDENGNADTTCGVTKSDDGFYSITVPSKIGENGISTLSNTLFTGTDMATFQTNKYSKIENIVIEEGITTLEDGDLSVGGTFVAIGTESIDYDSELDAPVGTFYNRNISVTIPSTLTKIGALAFALSGVNNITFNLDESNNSNLETIGTYAFIGTNISNLTLLEGLKIIGDYAFQFSNIDDLTLPSGINTIGKKTFQLSNIDDLTISGDIENINVDTFEGSTINNLVLKEGITKINDWMFALANIKNSENKPLIIPASVKMIGDAAFYNNKNLTTLIFENTTGSLSQLNTIGNAAFRNCSLDYQNEDSPLYLPNTITLIGSLAFSDNSNLKYIYFEGDESGFGSSWNGDATILPRRN